MLLLWIKACTEYFGPDCLLPIMGEPTCPELNHKVHKGQGCELISIYENPVIDKVVIKATKDAGDLQFIVNTSFGIDEVIEAVVFEVLCSFW